MTNRPNEEQKYYRKPPVEFTDERKKKFLEYYRDDPKFRGLKALSAEAVGVSLRTVDAHLAKDKVFCEEFYDAKEAWIDEVLYTEAVRRATEGTLKPIIGGKFKDQVVAHERVFSDSLMGMMLRSTRPEFRDKETGQFEPGHPGRPGGSGNSGVMIVPSGPQTVGDWQKTVGHLAKGEHGRGDKS